MDLLYLEWEDFESKCHWQSGKDIDDWIKQPAVIKEVGWLVKETPRYLVITSQLDGENIGNSTKILKKFIVKRETYEIGEKPKRVLKKSHRKI
jgi:hypothetical protein